MKIKSIRKINSHPTTYDLSIEGNHNYFVTKDDLLVHNSGKDPSKVDRSAAYAARYVAKNLVAAEVCDRCEIQLSYAIGVAEPTSISIDTFGTTHNGITDDILLQVIKETFDLRPNGIIHMLDLQRPIYKQTAAYGHFGRTDVDLPWEKLDQVDTIKTAIQKYIDAK